MASYTFLAVRELLSVMHRDESASSFACIMAVWRPLFLSSRLLDLLAW